MFAINADEEDAQELTLDLRAFEGWRFAGHTVMNAEHPEDRNTYEQPDVILPKENREAAFEKGICTAVLPPLSWNMFRLTKD